jgi:hypothetical protein
MGWIRLSDRAWELCAVVVALLAGAATVYASL